MLEPERKRLNISQRFLAEMLGDTIQQKQVDALTHFMPQI